MATAGPAKPKTKNLSPADAQRLYIGRFRLSYTVSAKFTEDHLVAAPNLSKQTSIEAAVKRYQRQPSMIKSSWMLLDASTLKNKAASAEKTACIHQGAQQMAMAIKVLRRTVHITAKTRKEIQGSNPKDYIVVKLADGERFLTCKSDMDEVTLCVKGSWKPLTGEVDLYHYGEGSLPSIAILPKYLEWIVDDSGKPLFPTAKS